ncbi:unnamed protein product [Durusdinium trenchii]
MAESPLKQAVLTAGSLAAGLSARRRKVGEVTLDPQTADCAQEIRNMLRQDDVSPEVAQDVVRALSAFGKMRILHTQVLNVLRDLPESTWKESFSLSMMVEAISSYAEFQLEDPEFNQVLAGLIVSRGLKHVKAFELAKLVFAAASLELGDFEGVYATFLEAFRNTDMTRLGSFDLCRCLWSLARLRPHTGGGKLVVEAKPLAKALARKRGIFGPSLAQAVWALPRLGLSDDVEKILEVSSGAVLAPGDQAQQLRRLAESCESPGLQAAVLNAAALRYTKVKDFAKCNEIFEYMAEKDLWTPVSYALAKRVGSHVQGSPPLPGMRTPGPKAHKYVRALYHALSRAKPLDAQSALAGLEHFSRISSRNWLKFGAADEKGKVLEDAWATHGQKKEDCLAVEFGTFLGYSAVKMQQQLGDGSRVISFEMDPEVACLALNFIEFVGLSDVIEVRIGQCEDLVDNLKEELEPGSVDVVYMDHNQMTYHRDLAQLQQSRLLSREVLFAATQCLKPGAPLLLWQLVQERKVDVWSALEIVSCPDCGFNRMEDWVVLARGAAKTRSLKRREPKNLRTAPPRDLVLLAAECNLMRWRTAKGMVDEKLWDEFVQYVRRGMERAGISNTRENWPDQKWFDAARKLEYQRLDY